MKRTAIAAMALILLGALGAQAQMPPDKWWRRPELIQNLGLTPDQQERLDAIFRNSANDLIDLRGDMEKQSIALRAELDQPQLNRANIQKIATKISEARSRRFERELMMLVDMRGVLSEPQWNRMRAELDRHERRPEGEQQRQPMRRPRRQ